MIKWLDEAIIIEIHEYAIQKFGGVGGIIHNNFGINAPRNLFFYEGFADLYILAVKYAFIIIKNHPFNDGNKRTGFNAMRTFLAENEIILEFPDNTDDVIVAIADDKITFNDVVIWLKNLVIVPYNEI